MDTQPTQQSSPVIQVVAAQPRSAKSVVLASWLLLFFSCAASLVPGLGFGIWIIGFPILLVTFILSIITFTRGSVGHGILILLGTLVIAPLFIILAPIITTGIAISEAANAGSPSTTGSENAVSSGVQADPSLLVGSWKSTQKNLSGEYARVSFGPTDFRDNSDIPVAYTVERKDGSTVTLSWVQDSSIGGITHHTAIEILPSGNLKLSWDKGLSDPIEFEKE